MSSPRSGAKRDIVRSNPIDATPHEGVDETTRAKVDEVVACDTTFMEGEIKEVEQKEITASRKRAKLSNKNK